MKPAATSGDNGAFSVQKLIFRQRRYLDTIPPRKSVFEFALRARQITILAALATQFYAICGLASRQNSDSLE
jgi:hypothetical protein